MAGEFVRRDDWDLDAVVTGRMNQASSTPCDIKEWFDLFIDDDPLMRMSNTGWELPPDDFPTGFYETMTMSKVLDDLEGLYDHPVMLPASSEAIEVGSSGNTAETSEGAQQLQEGAGSSALADVDVVRATAKYKRRKNQHKQVVQHVTSDGLSSDLWAWRKYGQKPIKGSPFPRSYYRCSSMKGCLARKQVERSSSEPGMFTVTYTGEHSHTQPTRRSALAGISRPSKFSTSKKSSTAATTDEFARSMPKLPQGMSINNHESSPTSTSTMEDGPCACKAETTFLWGESENVDKTLNLPSLVLGEEIFMGFDELEGLGIDFALTGY
ncbi:probable WRKY transcription factor 29 [Punica granatum]|uniref:WRKY domain-containing protein n=2 Tax=Punica granatum TaxID=22663 RepID=A0A218WHV3_PUNGR|nr:probable WRKY transcription factor 29 [Punica granatum]OWM72088.1 hypothetical protein CDL15_Pgr017971 [Punica granatum]PKI36554.1 hypothetical protein CRG98_043056 [Punica granatum]